MRKELTQVLRQLATIEAAMNIVAKQVLNLQEAYADAEANSSKKEPETPKEVLTVKEAAAFIGSTENGIHSLTSKAQIPHYKRGNKLYFRKTELESWMTAEPVPTEQDYQNFAATCCYSNPVQRIVNQNRI